MTSIGSPSPFFLAGKKVYEVERSVRFVKGDYHRFTRTPSSAGDRKTWTWSAWIKRGSIGNRQILFSADNNASNATYLALEFQADDNFRCLGGTETQSSQITKETQMVFRDTSAWYHLVFVLDATNSIARLYVNNSEVTDWNTNLNPSNQNYQINATTQHFLGRYGSSLGSSASNYFDGYMAEVNFIDGQAYDPSYFGETDPITGQWNPKKYTGSYGTNGFYLNFSDNSGTTATTLGKDSSGNGNNFTPNNFSVATGVDNDSVVDTPTNNFSILNPLDKAAAITTQNGNLQIAGSSTGNYNGIRASFGAKTGKYYWEIKFPNTGYITTIGIARADAGRIDNGNQPTYRIVLGLGSWFTTYNSNNVDTFVNANINYGNWSGASNYSTNDVYMIAVDFTAGKIWWGKNGSWFNNSGTANPATGTDPRITFTTGNEWFPYSQEASSTSCNPSYNFGQQGFVYTPPLNFVALSSANLPDPTIKLPNKHFDTLLYTGDSNTSRNITGLQFQPDWVWIKRRSASANHRTLDSVRGSTKEIYPNLTSSEQTFTGISSFNSDGFTLATADGSYNLNSATYVAWNWNAGDTDGKTYTVTVVSDSGNKYRFDGFGTSAVTLDLAEGGTYTFDGSDSSMSGHPFVIGTAANGSVYSTGVTYQLDGASVSYSAYTSGYATATTRKLIITVPASAPQLYYWCSIHSGMGGAINTNSTLGSSNFDGSIQSAVKANPTAGFSIVSYSGNQTAAATFGHGLGIIPRVVIVKRRIASEDWMVGVGPILGSGEEGHYLKLNSSAAKATGNGPFNSTNPSSSVVTLGTDQATNDNGEPYICYCFSEVAGYSKFGSYTGNGSSDGTFVFTGFRPSWVMIKISSTTENWTIFDNKRSEFNLSQLGLYANSNSAEVTISTNGIDILSNGFKLRGTGSRTNKSNGTFIYLAFAESPFKNARAR